MFCLNHERGKRFFPVCAVLVHAAALLLPAASVADVKGPMDVVRESNEAVLEIYRTTDTVDAAVEERIFAIIDGVTDYESLADGATARSCRDLSDEQCKTFRDVFIELLRVSSVKKLGRYRADRFEYLAEETTGDGSVVETTAFFGEDEFSLVYHLVSTSDGWRIVNYVVDDVDTVRNYKKQFQRLFSTKSYEEVVQRLRDRIASYEQEEGE